MDASRAGRERVDERARRIALEAPSLAELSGTELEKVARIVVGQRLVHDLGRKAELAGLDYDGEKASFLENAGRTKSANTKRAYSSALKRLEAFAARRALPVLALKPKDADDFSYSLAAEGRASASVRRDIAACSSFYSFLERRCEAVKNPFRGTRARPVERAAKTAAYPTDADIEAILWTLSGELRAAVCVMLYRGLRVGALPSLTIRADRFTARSKGKEVRGELPIVALDAILEAGLDSRRPFEETTATRIADAFRRRTRKLAGEGRIAAAYSVHDLRHLFAVREYRRSPDIYRLSKLLHHASITVTEVYLRGLGEIT